MRIIAFLAALVVMATTARAEIISIATFNVENLFDTVDDPDNPRDDTYLPLAVKEANVAAHHASCEMWNGETGFYTEQCKTLDWSDDVYSQKLARLFAALLQGSLLV